MPQLKFSGMDGIDEATISSFHVKVGQSVKKGDNIFDIEADKASDTITSPYDGKVSKINFKPGDTIKNGDIIIEFDGTENNESVKQEISEDKEKNNESVKQEISEDKEKNNESVKQEISEDKEKNNESVKQEISEDKEKNNESVKQEISEEKFKNNNIVLATPLSRKIARDLGIDITTIKGTGPNGRVLKVDIENAKGKNFSSFNKSESQVNVSVNSINAPKINVQKIESYGTVEHMPLSGIRKSIANTIAISKYTAPHVTLIIDVDATNLIGLRTTLKEEAIKPENGSIKLTFMPFFIKAVATALTEERFKLLNSTLNLQENEILVKKYYNIGMAADTDKGLVVPVIKNANELTLFEIAKQVNELADKARKGTLSVSEMQGASFTITNFGSAGLKYGTPIINYPEVAILGIGILESKALLINDNIVFHQFFPLSISIDHRVVDGAPAGYFMQKIKYLLENPALLLLNKKT